jgi:hypothetical protein
VPRSTEEAPINAPMPQGRVRRRYDERLGVATVETVRGIPVRNRKET